MKRISYFILFSMAVSSFGCSKCDRMGCFMHLLQQSPFLRRCWYGTISLESEAKQFLAIHKSEENSEAVDSVDFGKLLCDDVWLNYSNTIVRYLSDEEKVSLLYRFYEEGYLLKESNTMHVFLELLGRAIQYLELEMASTKPPRLDKRFFLLVKMQNKVWPIAKSLWSAEVYRL